jgi:hypothetical protein
MQDGKEKKSVMEDVPSRIFYKKKPCGTIEKNGYCKAFFFTLRD